MNTHEHAESGMMEDSNITNIRWYQRINYIKNKHAFESNNNSAWFTKIVIYYKFNVLIWEIRKLIM